MEKGLITHAVLEDLAGTTAFRRGEEYFSVGAVGHLRVSGDKITARVEGTETYQVELRDEGGDLAYDCTCPRAADGYFCKHCVATGLAWLAENQSRPFGDYLTELRVQFKPKRNFIKWLDGVARSAMH